MRWHAFLLTTLLCSSTRGATGQVPVQRLADMHHTVWTAKDGLRGVGTALAQTPDGFLWVGTSDGLYQFDGVRFENYQPRQGAMAAVSVSLLLATPDGGLWVGHTRGGVTHLAPNGTATGYQVSDSIPLGIVRGLAIDPEGAVWLAAAGGLARYADGKWQRIRKDWNYPGGSAWDVHVDPQGTLWVGCASPERLVYLPRGSRRFIDLGLDESGDSFASLNDSTVAVAGSNYDKGLVSLIEKHATGYTLREVAEGYGSNAINASDGAIYVVGKGLTRLRAAASPDRQFDVESYQSADGLSGISARAVLFDREGAMWVATSGGLDRFRYRNLTWKPDSLTPIGASLFTDGGGEAWVMSFRPTAIRRAHDLVPVNGPVPELLDNGYVDPQGNTWILTRAGLFRWNQGKFNRLRAPPSQIAKGWDINAAAVARQRTGRLWVSIMGTGVFSLDDSAWSHKEILPGRGDWTAISAFTDANDDVWLAYRDEIARIHGDSVQVYGEADGILPPILTLRGSTGLVLVGGERGLQVFKNDRFHLVEPADITLGTITTIVPTEDGTWLAGSAGILHLPQAEANRLARDPTARVHFDLFDMESDLPDAPKVSSRGFIIGTADRDGILWFATNRGLARVDPRAVVRNRVPPPVAFRAVFADEKRYWLQEPLTLPPNTRTLRIEFTALSLLMPARVRFRHMLEGWEKEWHEPHDRREVTYTNLRPGHYVLRVKASNNDGVWNDAGAALAFTVAPAWYQTAWFLALVIVVMVVTAIATYHYRVRQLAAAMSVRFNERLTERTRIARDLHDTLMQTVQASRMVAESSLSSDERQLRPAMERLSTWLNQAVEEGRKALSALRAAPGSSTDLADALRRAAEQAAAEAPSPLAVTLEGSAGELHPLMSEEIYHIGCEAIHNAALHARASRLRIEIAQQPDLVLRIADNGIGMDAAVARNGKAGHFGLRGMRERATAIGGVLTIDSSPEGTTVTLTVPVEKSRSRPA